MAAVWARDMARAVWPAAEGGWLTDWHNTCS